MSIKITYYLIVLMWMLPLSSQDETAILDYKLLVNQSEFVAGEPVVLSFQGPANQLPDLLVSYSLGSTIVAAAYQDDTIIYKLPAFINKQAGIVDWSLHNTHIKGAFIIKPQSQIAQMETYVGPSSIAAGTKNYSLAITIPLDIYDNPAVDGTPVNFHFNKEEISDSHQVVVENLIAFDYINSTKKTGKILLAASAQDIFSKEFTVDVKAGMALDFTLSRKRNHNYADGNQLVTFYTSILKDIYGNIVSDGTLVNFYITTSTGIILQTTGMSIKGIATASMVHPEKAASWSVKAVVERIASSNTVTMDFKPVFESYEVKLSQENRNIAVGPLKSFMGQIIPDGVTVSLDIKGEKWSETYTKQSYNGMVHFKLNPDLIPNGFYNFTITAGGITNEIKNVTL